MDPSTPSDTLVYFVVSSGLVCVQQYQMMMSTGIVPDAMVSRCLVDAFAMDDSFSDGGAHPLSLLDWSKFQPKHRDGR